MIWPPQNTGLFAVAECASCCEEAPAEECPCALITKYNDDFGSYPPPGFDFPTHGDARTFLDSLKIASGIAYLCPGLHFFTFTQYLTIVAFTADNSTPDSLVLHSEVTAPPGSGGIRYTHVFAIAIAEGTSITIDWAFTDDAVEGGNTVTLKLLNCLDPYDTIDVEVNSEDNPGSHVFADIPAGKYIITIDFFAQNAESCTFDATVTSDDAMVINEVISKVDPAANVLNDEVRAVPALDLGLVDYFFNIGLFPSAPYADEATALAVLESAWVAGCVAFNPDPDGLTDSFTATGGASLVVNATTHGFSINSQPSFLFGASLNLEASSTLSVAWTSLSNGTDGGDNISVYIYNRLGSLIGSDFGLGTSGTVTIPVTKQGEYVLVVSCFGAGNPTAVPPQTTTDFGITVTSDLTMTTNPVAALADRGVDCPQRIICEEAP